MRGQAGILRPNGPPIAFLERLTRPDADDRFDGDDQTLGQNIPLRRVDGIRNGGWIVGRDALLDVFLERLQCQPHDATDLTKAPPVGF